MTTKTEGIRGLAGNASALAVLQIFTYAVPLLLIPYLTRILGIELYGVVAFGLAITQIACMVTDYGFNMSATYQIAKANGDREEVGRTICAVMACKVILFVAVSAGLASFILVDGKYDDYEIYFWLLLLAIFGQTFQPLWFFQGVERMFYITVYSSIGRLIYMAAVFYFVSEMNDYWLVAVSNGIAHTMAAVLGVAIMLRMGYRLAWPGWKSIRACFSSSTQFFWARAAVSTYTAGGTFFLGLVASPVQIALYAAAEQLYRGMVMLIVPLHQALYPYMARTRNVKLFSKILFGAIGLAILGLSIGIYIAPWVIRIIYGEGFEDVYPVLLVFMVVFTIVIPSGLLGYPFLAALGNPGAANKSVMYGGVIQLLLLCICYAFGWAQAVNVVFAVFVVEVFVFLYRVFVAKNMVFGKFSVTKVSE